MLHFKCRGEWFKVREDGCMTHEKSNEFSGQWKFLGVSFHHFRQGIDLFFVEVTDPKELVGGIVWDLDHGTTRQWGGQYFGRLPRITSAYFKDEEANN